MKRRVFLKILSAVSAVIASPTLLAKFSNYNVNGYREDMGEYARIKRYQDVLKAGDTRKVIITFYKKGYQDIVKLAMVSQCAIACNPNVIEPEMAYQIAKSMKEAHRDYLFLEYGDDWRKHDALIQETQLKIFIQDMDNIKLRSI